MSGLSERIERHYARGEILDSIVKALAAMGKDPAGLAPSDLALVDEFHIRGRQATVELARHAAPTPGLKVLDVGCGLGGSARHLAGEYGCRVTGVDLTREYVEVAAALAEMVGMKDKVEFLQADALELPFADGSFDLVWTEHVQMNIPDKKAFYGEIARVLAPGGRLLFHDVFLGSGGAAHYPVPWAEEGSASFLAAPEEALALVEGAGFSVELWEDTSQKSVEWFAGMVRRLKESGAPPLGVHLLMGKTARQKSENLARNLSEQRVVAVQGLVRKK